MLPISLFRSGGPAGLLLPYHHTVSDEELQHICHLYPYKNIQQFSDDLDFLLKYYKPVSAADVSKSISEQKALPAGSFLLTFDDGFREVYDIIAPILEKKGVPAIFFINPSFIGNMVLFYRCKISLLIGELKRNEQPRSKIYAEVLGIKSATPYQLMEALKKIDQTNASLLDTIADATGYSFTHYLSKQRPFLTDEEVAHLHRRGFDIGAHSMDHPYYKLLSEEEQVWQTVNSCECVKEITGSNECHFSFPHSDMDISQATISSINLAKNGLLFGIQNQKEELNNNILHRFNAERPETNIEALVKGQIILNRLQKMAGRNSVKRN